MSCDSHAASGTGSAQTADVASAATSEIAALLIND